MKQNMKHEEALRAFEKRAGIAFKSRELLERAFTHRSYLNEAHAGSREHNERLEFLGDAVLELSVTDHLFRAYPAHTEGDLTSYRAALVNAVTLSGIAESLGMNECLLLSKGEAKDTGRARATILANTLEALIGALYLDQGYAPANDFVLRHVAPHIKEVLAKGAWRDAKSAFQEYAQEKYGMTPKYTTVKAEGPDHDKHFVVSVSVGDVVLREGEGKSKQEAEQMAAEKALKEKED
ncbi:ribonuclease III [Candidatus Kaiserbacteria bacterium]|nr:ribonuclease III [Candidatus Kaiserbacteria bacterium]